MKNSNEKGFALVLSLVLLLAMSLMGGALIVISAGDHQSNNTSDDYQQTFYVAETALLEGEKYLLNQYLGPWENHKRNVSKRNLPDNLTTVWAGKMEKPNKKNYDNGTTFIAKSGKSDSIDICKTVSLEDLEKWWDDSYDVVKDVAKIDPLLEKHRKKVERRKQNGNQ